MIMCTVGCNVRLLPRNVVLRGKRKTLVRYYNVFASSKTHGTIIINKLIDHGAKYSELGSLRNSFVILPAHARVRGHGVYRKTKR